MQKKIEIIKATITIEKQTIASNFGFFETNIERMSATDGKIPAKPWLLIAAFVQVAGNFANKPNSVQP